MIKSMISKLKNQNGGNLSRSQILDIIDGIPIKKENNKEQKSENNKKKIRLKINY